MAPAEPPGRSPGRGVATLLSLLAWAVVWEVVGRSGLAMVVPPLSRVLGAGLAVMGTGTFWAAARLSLRTFAVGMALALAVGIPLGIAMARLPAVGRLLSVWVSVFVSAPVSAVVPVLMAVLGIGETTVVVTVFLFAVFVICLDTEVGVRQADRSLVEMARVFGAGRGALYTKVLLPAALPEILAGVRLGAVRGVKGTVIGQLLVALLGVGALFELYAQHFLMEEFWALVLTVFVFAFLVSEGVGVLERRVARYARAR